MAYSADVTTNIFEMVFINILTVQIVKLKKNLCNFNLFFGTFLLIYFGTDCIFLVHFFFLFGIIFYFFGAVKILSLN